MGLVGRVEECQVLDELLDSARGGLAGTLVIRGEPGIGKSALIDYAMSTAGDFQVVHLTGIESECELGFAALHRLLTPILHRIDRLPEPQRRAMSSAFGLGPITSAERFMVGLATVSLAAESASFKPVLCVVDDAQWVDRESIDALAFWGRRLHAERCALVFGERDLPETASPLEGFPVLRLRGLAEPHARALLAREGGLDRHVAERIVAETGGNPLALLELAKDLTSAQLTGDALLPQPLPLSRRLEERFLRQVRSLPVETQTLLLLAAAEPTGDAALLWRAAGLIDVTPGSADGAEAEGLLVLLPKVAFRHPLIRSAVYSGAEPGDRRRVHQALAAATDAADDADRRAWHLAAGAFGPDEAVAAVLERSAQRARTRGGHVAETAFLSRSAELTPDRGQAAGRRLAAAEAALAGGSPLQTQALVDLARPDLGDVVLRANADRLEGSAWLLLGRASMAAPILLSAALAMRPSDASRSRRTMLKAVEAAVLSGYVTVSKKDLAAAIVEDLDETADATIVELLLVAFATYATYGYASAVPLLRRALTALGAEDVPPEEFARWSILASNATTALWDHDAYEELMVRLAARSRERGALLWLAVALRGCAAAALWEGRFGAADAYYSEARDVGQTAEDNKMSALMEFQLLAWRGLDAETRARTATVMAMSSELGLASGAALAHQALAVLDLSTGQYQAALEHARAVFEEDPLPFGHQVLPDMVEAAVRAGRPDAAHLAVDRLAEIAPASESAWALGLLARSRALLATEEAAEALYVEALELLGSTRMAVELARTHLLYGEWLRRQKRRADARDELRAAYDMFVSFGADGFAARAREELLATGEHARKRTVDTSNALTPQEAHVARLAAAGGTNGEIAAQLFISASTVEYHLRKVFRKLAITSRRQLKRALSDVTSS